MQARSQVDQSTMTGGNIEQMLYSECGAKNHLPQPGEDFIPAMYMYHVVIILL